MQGSSSTLDAILSTVFPEKVVDGETPIVVRQMLVRNHFVDLLDKDVAWSKAGDPSLAGKLQELTAGTVLFLDKTSERYWKEMHFDETPEHLERRIMEQQPGRWLARFPQNKPLRESRNSCGVVFDAVFSRLQGQSKNVSLREVICEVQEILAWHPEFEANDRVSECRWSEEQGDWEIVVIKPDGQIIGNSTKTLEDLIRDRIIARSRTTGAHGGKLILGDPFLGTVRSS